MSRCTTEKTCAPLGRFWVDGSRQVNTGGAYRALCTACGQRVFVAIPRTVNGGSLLCNTHVAKGQA